MAKLWKKLPPLMADNFGFIEVVNRTDGMGIIDDCSEYRTSAERRRGRRNQGELQMRVVHTQISSEDVVSGTRQNVLETWREYRQDFQPSFLLLSAGPCSAMIGTDLEEIAQQISRDDGVKSAAIKLSGHKTYDTGISETLLALVKLLTKPGNVRPGSVNILGATTLDWQEENAASLRGWLKERGFEVIADLGGSEKAENIAKAGEAAVNLVVTAAGLAAAKYLQKEYGTPYVAAAPFGKSWSDIVLTALAGKEKPESEKQSRDQQPDILIIGEQFMGNALRETLIRDYGRKNIQVCSFYMLDKTLAWPGDKKIRSEKEAQELIQEGKFQTIIADPLLRCFAPQEIRWIDLPHKAFQLYGEHPPLPLFLGENLNGWLDRQI